MEFDFEAELRESQQKAEDILKAYLVVFSHPEARLVIEDLCEYASVFAPTYREGRPDRSAHEEGMRRVVLRILRFSGIEKRLKRF